MKFQDIYSTRPDKSNIGSNDREGYKLIYDYVKKINPDIIIESGVWRGNTSWIFKHLVDELYLYDINFNNLLFRDEKIHYRNYDITKDYWGDINKSNNILIYFDDHISQKDRLDYAIENGFTHILFDDNFTEEECKKFRNPAYPTLEMVKADYEIEYVRHNQKSFLTYVKILKTKL